MPTYGCLHGGTYRNSIYLSFDNFAINCDASSRKFHTYGGLGLQVELISRKTR